MHMNHLALLTAPARVGTRPPGGVEVLGLAVVLAQEDRLQLVRQITIPGLYLHIIFRVGARPLPLAGYILQAKAVGLRLLARVLPFNSLAQTLPGHGARFLGLPHVSTVGPVDFNAEPPGFRSHTDHPLRTGGRSGRGDGLVFAYPLPAHWRAAAYLQLGHLEGPLRLADGGGQLQHDLPRGHIGPDPNGQIHRFWLRQIRAHINTRHAEFHGRADQVLTLDLQRSGYARRHLLRRDLGDLGLHLLTGPAGHRKGDIRTWPAFEHRDDHVVVNRLDDHPGLVGEALDGSVGWGR